MALYHDATVTPSKMELIQRWAPTQDWFPTSAILADDLLIQVPLIYQAAPLDDGDGHLVGTFEHSALGTRWVYDGLADQRYLMLLAGAAMTGQGEALGMVVYDGRWHIAPSEVRLTGGGWSTERVAVDAFEVVDAAPTGDTKLSNDGFELTFFRRPRPSARPTMGLSAECEGQPEPVLLAVVRAGLGSPT